MLPILNVDNDLLQPQTIFKGTSMDGLDKDGNFVKMVEDNFLGSYLVLFFLPLGMTSDSEEILKFKSGLQMFETLNCRILGITNESPFAIKRWLEKKSGGTTGFPIVSDKDLRLGMTFGVARECGLHARSTFIIDPRGQVRYTQVMSAGSGRSVDEILRLVSALQASDEQGKAVPAGWTPGEELVPILFSEKVEYFRRKFSSSNDKSNNIQESEEQQLRIGAAVSRQDTQEENAAIRVANIEMKTPITTQAVVHNLPRFSEAPGESGSHFIRKVAFKETPEIISRLSLSEDSIVEIPAAKYINLPTKILKQRPISLERNVE